MLIDQYVGVLRRRKKKCQMPLTAMLRNIQCVWGLKKKWKSWHAPRVFLTFGLCWKWSNAATLHILKLDMVISPPHPTTSNLTALSGFPANNKKTDARSILDGQIQAKWGGVRLTRAKSTNLRTTNTRTSNTEGHNYRCKLPIQLRICISHSSWAQLYTVMALFTGRAASTLLCK